MWKFISRQTGIRNKIKREAVFGCRSGAQLEHLTKCCSHMATGEFLVKQPVRFEPLAYFHKWRILREYSTGE